MTGQKNSVLTLMFSVTGSMASYQSAGSYPRFVARLQAYAAHFERVHVCTYDQRDYTGEWLLSNVRHHPMPRFLASSIPYHLLSPMLHRGALEETTTIRAFNITGALPALLVRAYSGAPIMVSYGYSLPDFVRHESGTLKYHVYRLVEEIALRRCDRILCATPSQTESLGARYGRGKVTHLPNCVDVQRFRPVNGAARDYLLFVGRLTAQKNLESLLAGLRLALDQGLRLPPLKIIGEGDLRAALRQQASRLEVPVEFCGTVPNDQLPDWYAHAWAYVLPSLFEGMPKTLLEAMSCGVPCLGSTVEGIRELISHGQDGLLVEPTPEGIAKGLRWLVEDDTLRRSIAEEGRRTVVERFSLTQVLAREIEILQEACQ